MGTKAALAPREVKVATEVWIAAALLHQEQPERADWTIEEIVHRVEKESIYPVLRAGIRVHATLHCVANRKTNPARLRMLYATSKSGRRLYKPGDPVEDGRTGPTHPDRSETPPNYHYLIDWYENDYAKQTPGADDGWLSGLFEMDGMGKGMWTGVDPDEYVRQLREGWE